MLIVKALTVDCVEFQPLTIDYVHVYGRMHSDSTPSLVYGLTSIVAALTIESTGVTPPCRASVKLYMCVHYLYLTHYWVNYSVVTLGYTLYTH